MRYFKGKNVYLSVDDSTKRVTTVINQPGEFLIRSVEPAGFYDKMLEDLTNGVIEETTMETFTLVKNEVVNRIATLNY